MALAEHHRQHDPNWCRGWVGNLPAESQEGTNQLPEDLEQLAKLRELFESIGLAKPK